MAMQRTFDDDVRGFIIGDVTFPYEFWSTEVVPGVGEFEHRICRGHFASDEEAVKWFAENYPEHYKSGAEMRVFDVEQK